MTEGQDAGAASSPLRGVGEPAAAAAGRSLESAGGPGSAPAGGAVPWAAFARVAMTAPVSAGPPGIAAEAEKSGTGWPGGHRVPVDAVSADLGGADADEVAPGEDERGEDGRGDAGTGGNGNGSAEAADTVAAGTVTPGAPGWPAAGAAGATGAAEGAGAAGPASGEAAESPFWTRPGSAAADVPEDAEEPFARVDAKKLEAALLALRRPIMTVPLALEAPGVAEARVERVKLLSQMDDYLLPRLRQSGAPILVALVGSTGAGKSTLLNSVAGKQVSATGIRRPTTNSPVLACHPDDVRWFAENVFLPTLPRVRQQGLAMPGRDGLLVLAASEGMPKGVAVLDTPDIDSVVQAHRDFAHQFLDASDLWLFVTTARRYADAAVWEMLQDARDRGAALAIALSRVPPAAAAELVTHFEAMLEANDLREERRFIIPETTITDSRLPDAVAAPVLEWLSDTARREDRRVAVLTQTMSGVLDTFRERIPALADQVSGQAVLRRQLRDVVDSVFTANLAEFDEEIRSGSLVQGELLARWQDFAGTGDLLRTLQVRRGRGAARQKKQGILARATAVQEALHASVRSLVEAVADRAAETVVNRWQQNPAGAGLLAGFIGDAAVAARSSEDDFVATALADLGLVSKDTEASEIRDPGALIRATPGLAANAERAVSAWQEHVIGLVRAENVTKRSVARVVTFDEPALALVLAIGVLGSSAADGSAGAGDPAGADNAAAPQRVLESLFGAGSLRDLATRVRQDLSDRAGRLLAVEAQRFFAIIDAVGVPEESTAAELLQAAYGLEEAR